MGKKSRRRGGKKTSQSSTSGSDISQNSSVKDKHEARSDANAASTTFDDSLAALVVRLGTDEDGGEAASRFLSGMVPDQVDEALERINIMEALRVRIRTRDQMKCRAALQTLGHLVVLPGLSMLRRRALEMAALVATQLSEWPSSSGVPVGAAGVLAALSFTSDVHATAALIAVPEVVAELLKATTLGTDSTVFQTCTALGNIADSYKNRTTLCVHRVFFHMTHVILGGLACECKEAAVRVAQLIATLADESRISTVDVSPRAFERTFPECAVAMAGCKPAHQQYEGVAVLHLLSEQQGLRDKLLQVDGLVEALRQVVLTENKENDSASEAGVTDHRRPPAGFTAVELARSALENLSLSERKPESKIESS